MKSNKIKETVAKLLEINKLILKLDRSIRAQAFEILAPLYFESEESGAGSHGNGSREQKTGAASQKKFFSSFDHDKANDRVYLICAWHFSQHGMQVITRKRIEEIGTETGLVLPNRPDMTLTNAKHDGKKLFMKVSGGFKPTVHGATYFENIYKVTMGNKPLPDESDQ